MLTGDEHGSFVVDPVVDGLGVGLGMALYGHVLESKTKKSYMLIVNKSLSNKFSIPISILGGRRDKLHGVET